MGGALAPPPSPPRPQLLSMGSSTSHRRATGCWGGTVVLLLTESQDRAKLRETVVLPVPEPSGATIHWRHAQCPSVPRGGSGAFVTLGAGDGLHGGSFLGSRYPPGQGRQVSARQWAEGARLTGQPLWPCGAAETGGHLYPWASSEGEGTTHCPPADVPEKMRDHGELPPGRPWHSGRARGGATGGHGQSPALG